MLDLCGKKALHAYPGFLSEGTARFQLIAQDVPLIWGGKKKKRMFEDRGEVAKQADVEPCAARFGKGRREDGERRREEDPTD
ncbi:hypothetical protein KM043_016554 [Ampulex compressa]|nr:hypothetical protein KM043_016554 [Ampulex compressa]